jgi:hypothetical protein
LRDLPEIPILRELIAALNRRTPQVRSDEAAIAKDSAALMSRALNRIAQLERESASAEADLPRS